MSLGETIYRLRTERGMSQEELAERLEVSRQSVSKWENGGSVPELDKLIRLSGVFGVSLDELVKGEPPAPEPPPERKPGVEGRYIAGGILLGISLLGTLLMLMPGGGLSGLILSAPLWLCGIVCLLCRRDTALWCGWVLFLSADLYLRYSTGITWRLVRLTPVYAPEWNYTRLALAWGELICWLGLFVLTAVVLLRRPLAPGGKNAALTAIAFLLALAMLGASKAAGLVNQRGWYFVCVAADWAFTALLFAAALGTARMLRSRRKNE